MTQAVTETIRLIIQAKADQAKDEIKQTGDRIKQFDVQAKRDFEEVQKKVADLERQLEKMQQGATDSLGKAGRASDDLAKKGQGLRDSFASSLKVMESGVQTFTRTSVAGFAALTAAMGVTAKTVGDFQAQVNTLQAVSGASASELDMLEQKSLALGASTKFSASQMAETSVELAKLGFVSNEIIDAMDGIVASAAASGASLRDSGELIAGTVRGFGLAAKDAGMVADVLAKAANVSALGFDDLALSMKYVAPIAAASGQKLTDIVGVMGILSNNMIKGEQAGTSMRGMLAKLQAPSDQAAKYMKTFNFSIEDAEKKIKPLPQMILELQDKLSGLSDKNKAKVLTEIFGIEGLSAAQALMKSSRDELENMISSLNNAKGSSQETADIMNQGLNYELTVLKSTAEGAAIAFGKELAPTLESAIRTLREIVDWFGKLPAPVKDTIIQVGLFAAALLAIGGTGGAALLFTSALVDAATKIGLVGSAAELAAGKVGAFKAALLGLPGLVGLGVGLAANAGINAVASVIDRETEKRNANTATVGESNTAQSRLNAFLRSTGGNPEKASDSQLKSALSDIQAVQKATEELIQAETELAALKRDLRSKEAAYGVTGQLSQEQKDELEALKQKIRLKEQEAKANSDQIQQAHRVSERYLEIEKKLTSELEKRQKSQKKEGIDPNKDALLQESDPEELKRVSEYFSKLKTTRETAMQAIEKSVVEHGGRVASTDTVMSDRLVKNAETVATKTLNSYNKCLTGVQYAFKATYGEYIKTGASAYMAAEALAKDPRFQEVQVSDAQMRRLPKGTIVVHDRSSDPARRYDGRGGQHGHISIADGNGNELSDHKQSQMIHHYAGGGRRVFVPAGSSVAQSAEEIAGIQKAQVIVNQQLAEAIQYQNQFAKGSEAWKKAEEGIIELKKTSGKLGIDLAKAEAQALEEVRKQQEKNHKALVEQLDSLKKGIVDMTADLQKALAQEGMRPLEKMQDDFDRAIQASEAKLVNLQQLSKNSGLSDQQKLDLLLHIKGVQADISELIQTQDNAMTHAEQKQALEYKLNMMQQSHEFELQSIEAMQNEVSLQREILDEQDRAFQAKKAGGKVTAKDELQFQLKQNAARRELLEMDLALAEQKSKENGEDVNRSQDVLRLRNQINDSRRQETAIMQDFSAKVKKSLDEERKLREEIFGLAVNGFTSMLNATGLLNDKTSAFINTLSQGLPAIAQLADKIQTAASSWGEGKLDSSAIGLAMDAGKIYQSIVFNQGGMINQDAIKMQVQQHALDMLNLENQITATRIENRKKEGATVKEQYEDERKLIESQAQAAIQAQEQRLTQLKAKKSNLFGLGYTAEEQIAVTLAEQAIQKERLRISEDTQERLKELERRRLEEEEKLAKASYEARAALRQSMEDTALEIATAQARQTGDALDDLEIEREKRRLDAYRKYQARLKVVRDEFEKTGVENKDANKQAIEALNLAYGEIDQSINDEKQKRLDDAVNRSMDRFNQNMLLQAQRTADPFDDLEAEYNQKLVEIAQARDKELAQTDLTELEKQEIRDHYREQELTEQTKYSQKVDDLRKSELKKTVDDYKDLLSQQKSIIQDQLDTKRLEYQDLIKTKELELDAAEKRVRDEQKKLDDLRKARESEKQAFNPEDGVQSTAFMSGLAAFNADPASWAGVQEISNTQNVGSLANVSGETARLGLKKQADLKERQATNDFRRDLIDKQKYISLMQEAQIMRAKAADLELKTEGLTNEKKIDLEAEWADAYTKYQELATQAIDARYDAQERAIQANIDAQNQEMAKTREVIDGYKTKIGELETEASAKLKQIDDAIKAADNSTRQLASGWDDVAAGMEKAREAAEKAKAAIPSAPGSFAGSSGGSSSSTSRYIPTVYSKYDENGNKLNRPTDPSFSVPGKNGQWYRSDADRKEAEATKMAGGGGIRNPRAKGDRFAAQLDDWETVVPLGKWGEFLAPFLKEAARPYLPAAAGKTVNIQKTVMVSGNNFSSNIDVTRAVAAALEDRLGGIHNQVGFLYGV